MDYHTLLITNYQIAIREVLIFLKLFRCFYISLYFGLLIENLDFLRFFLCVLEITISP